MTTDLAAPAPPQPTTLYRMYDTDGALLYVGISKTLFERLSQHKDDKPWWAEIASIVLEHYPTRPEALAAEAAAIICERPQFNKVGFGPAPGKLVKLRIDSDQWDRFKAAVDSSPDPEADMSKVLRQMVRWYCRETGAKLPERPAEATR